MTPFKQPLEAVVDTENRLYGLPGAEPMRRGAAPAALDCVQLLAGHCDLSAIDNDDLRWGRPTTRRAYARGLCSISQRKADSPTPPRRPTALSERCKR